MVRMNQRRHVQHIHMLGELIEHICLGAATTHPRTTILMGPRLALIQMTLTMSTHLQYRAEDQLSVRSDTQDHPIMP